MTVINYVPDFATGLRGVLDFSHISNILIFHFSASASSSVDSATCPTARSQCEAPPYGTYQTVKSEKKGTATGLPM